MRSDADGFGPLDLLVLQPTPFCNIDCSYCYLPNRQSTRRMSAAVLDRVFAEVFASGLVRKAFTIVWHAGEPLVLPPVYYQDAIAQLGRHNSASVEVTHSFQTNGTLIDDAWCDFLQTPSVRIGVSVDGPEFLHDRCRKTRNGSGTMTRVRAGMRRLRERGIPFHVISVLTRVSLDYPDELFDFYQRERIERVGFNIEEIEGPNTSSTLSGPEVRAALSRFLGRFYDLNARSPQPMQVREFNSACSAIFRPADAPPMQDHQKTPFAILNIDCDGNFSTFSPELLGLASDRYGTFTLGNILTDSLADAFDSPRLHAIETDIRAGVERCRATCAYFDYCGGGAPGNKYFENGSFDSTETMFCRLSCQTVLDVMLDKLEKGSLVTT